MNAIKINLNKEKDFSNLKQLIREDFDIRLVFSDLVEERLYKSQRLYDVYNDEQYIGFCALVKYDKGAFAIDLGIAKEYRGRGYSKDIFTYVLSDIKHIGGTIYCETEKLNIPAKKTIESFGFKRYQTKKDMVKYYLDNQQSGKTK